MRACYLMSPLKELISSRSPTPPNSTEALICTNILPLEIATRPNALITANQRALTDCALIIKTTSSFLLISRKLPLPLAHLNPQDHRVMSGASSRVASLVVSEKDSTCLELLLNWLCTNLKTQWLNHLKSSILPVISRS